MQQIPENNLDVKRLLCEQLALLAKESQRAHNVTDIAIASREMRKIARLLLCKQI